MICLLVVLPLAVLAHDTTSLHDGIAIQRDGAKLERPAKYMRRISTRTMPEMPPSEETVSYRRHVSSHIPTPYFLANFTAGTPLFEGYRMLSAIRRHVSTTAVYKHAGKEQNRPRVRKFKLNAGTLLTPLTFQKTAKTVEIL
ncbi:hypothetical protein GCK32_000480 [Trichostrongylus colubriformis]|uniref:Uncharacterized protein n=1 Tax=Trichostrongylus colubriformis TaxID=6319 RepID=A0AAN8ERT1_TRICO